VKRGTDKAACCETISATRDKHASRRDQTTRPATCPDFLAVAFTHFYEQDRAKNFWHIDQVSRNEFAGACERLRRELAG